MVEAVTLSEAQIERALYVFHDVHADGPRTSTREALKQAIQAAGVIPSDDDHGDAAFAMRVAGFVREAACHAEAAMILKPIVALARLGAYARNLGVGDER